jgi:hypothetical protein
LTGNSSASVNPPPGRQVQSKVIPIYSWKIINSSTSQNSVNFSKRVAVCYPGGGGTCNISRGTSVGTTITTALGWSQSGIAASLGLSLSATSSTSVSCTSPKMSSGQYYSAYPVGIYKSYIIQESETNSAVNAPPPHVIATSGWLGAWQPYTYPALYCRVE